VNIPVTIRINGTDRRHEVEPRMLLVHFLRDVCQLTGTHVGCETSICGACTVLQDGCAVKSCTILAVQADGSEVTTVEGLARNGQLHPVQQAFLDQGAFQCAYCTSGMIVSSVALLQKNPNPSEPEIVQALQGNICRCGTHPRIVAAVQQAARAMHGAKS